MIIYIELLHKVKPYKTEEMNSLELKANIAAVITYYYNMYIVCNILWWFILDQ
jgi:hypothetical protein